MVAFPKNNIGDNKESTKEDGESEGEAHLLNSSLQSTRAFINSRKQHHPARNQHQKKLTIPDLETNENLKRNLAPEKNENQK